MILEIPPVTELGDGWSELFFIPYGDEDHQLGTSTGGDAGQLEIGPDYGAQAADGSWWFLDAANRRLAQYSQEGDYLDQVVLASEFLVEGQYWPYQLPHIVDDGTLVASWLDPETSSCCFSWTASSTSRSGRHAPKARPGDGARFVRVLLKNDRK